MTELCINRFTIVDERSNDFSLGPSLLLIILFSQLVERTVVDVVKFINIVINDVTIKMKDEVSNTIRDLCSSCLRRNN